MTHDQKDKNYWAVLDSVIRLEVSKGHLQWKVTELSRLSKVGRPLIYYYFGKSKEEIVQTALKIIGDEFFGLSDERIALWREGKVVESIMKTREMMEQAPYVSVFFFHWRHQKGEIADHLKDLESRYRKKISGLRPELSALEIEVIFAAFFGLTVFPDTNAQVVSAMVEKISRPLKT
jgi:AcrR family transcriptional regulator